MENISPFFIQQKSDFSSPRIVYIQSFTNRIFSSETKKIQKEKILFRTLHLYYFLLLFRGFFAFQNPLIHFSLNVLIFSRQ